VFEPGGQLLSQHLIAVMHEPAHATAHTALGAVLVHCAGACSPSVDAQLSSLH